jgi:hypothetical protein
MQENHEKISELIYKTYHQYLNCSRAYEKKEISDFGKIAEDKKFFWIRIPKCANQFVKTHTRTSMREIDYLSDHSKIISDEYNGFAILRDPLDRWFTSTVSAFITNNNGNTFNESDRLGLTQLLLKYKKYFSNLIEYTIEELSYEYHGLPQTWRLYLCNPNNIDFFYMNDKLGYQLNHYFRMRGIVTTMNNHKINYLTNKDLPLMRLLQEFIFDHSNQKYKEKIMEILKPDYELLSLVNFYTK